MGQSKKFSGFETITNIMVGFVVALIAQAVVFPIMGIFVSLYINLQVAAFFTIVGVIRMYIMRRFFNWLHMKGYN